MKNIFKSKTLWFNIITAILYLLDKDIMTTDSALQLNIIGNTLLRLATKKGLTFSKKENADPTEEKE